MNPPSRRSIWRLIPTLILASLLLIATHLRAADTRETVISISDLTDSLAISPRLSHWLDQTQSATLDTLPPANSPEWIANDSGKTNFGQTTAAFWLRFIIADLDQLEQQTYVWIDYPHLDQVDIYVLANQQVIEHYATGDTRPFAARPVNHRSFLLPLKKTMGQQVEIVMRVASEGPMQLPLTLITRSALDEREKSLYTWIGCYFGIMAIMLIYNGVIFLFVRDMSYLLYLVYIIATASLQFTLFGFSFQYLWPDSTSLNNAMILIQTAIMPFTAIAFVWRFIDLHRIGDRSDVVTTALLLMGFAIVLLGAFLMPYSTTLKLAHMLSFVAVILGFYLGVKYWLKGIKAARIFALAWFVYMVFIVYYLLSITSLIQPDVVSAHALEIGSMLEVALLSLAFADRLNSEKELRLNAQLKLNQDLDQLVRARTEELENANLRLKQMSNTDPLTSLCNRRHFNELFAIEYQRAYRDKSPLALLMIDVDHFKSINDTYGHPFGDRCLQQVASTIVQSTRRPPDLSARYGGEEFIVLLPGTDLQGARHVAETIRSRIEQAMIQDQNQSTQVTASIGVFAGVPGDRNRQDLFIQTADTMLYQAKHNGRNQVVASDQMQESDTTSPSPSSQKAG